MVYTMSDQTDPNEQALIERLQAGDQAAYAEMVETYAPRIYNLALRLMGDEAAAEDVLQETFLNAFKAIDRFEGRSQLGTWLYRIAHNTALMQLRKKEPTTFSLESPVETEDGEELPRQFFDFCCLPERELLSEEALQELRAAIDELPDSLRVVFVLRELEGLSTQETADELGLSVPAVKTRLMRARLALRERLAHYFARSSMSAETGEALSHLG
ncbi:MAG: sigma-70 family RNA polymerase sigma factor [Anaerolineae bacterium]